MGGATETLPFIQALGSNFAYTQMSFSQERYLAYFNEVLLHDFTPLFKPLILSKILIVFDEPTFDENQKDGEGSDNE